MNAQEMSSVRANRVRCRPASSAKHISVRNSSEKQHIRENWCEEYDSVELAMYTLTMYTLTK